MITSVYSANAVRELAGELVRGSGGTQSSARTVHAGGGWQMDTWQDEVIAALADRRPLTAIRVRSAPTDPILSDET